jgi:hypothetical protein
MSHVVTVPELLTDHVRLEIECIDRMYLSGHVPTLQVGGQVFTFLHDHRGMPVASPAVFGQISGRFRQAVDRFAQMNDIPVVKFKKGIRKLDDLASSLKRPSQPATHRRPRQRKDTRPQEPHDTTVRPGTDVGPEAAGPTRRDVSHNWPDHPAVDSWVTRHDRESPAQARSECA